jgi:hypothetical protein
MRSFGGTGEGEVVDLDKMIEEAVEEVVEEVVPDYVGMDKLAAEMALVTAKQAQVDTGIPDEEDGPGPLELVELEVIEGPRGQAIATIEDGFPGGWAFSSGNQPSREAALAKLAQMVFEYFLLEVDNE